MNCSRPINAHFIIGIILKFGAIFSKPFDDNFRLGAAATGPAKARAEEAELLVK